MGTGAYERLLSVSQVFFDPGWLPPPEECEQFADLREQHLRLLDAVKSTLAKLSAARERVDGTQAQRQAAMREAFLTGTAAELPPPPDVDLSEERAEYEAACEALEQFVQRAQAQIAARAPQVRAKLRERSLAAEEKRAEARRLLEEADGLASRPRALLYYLDRYTGRSALGPIAYYQLGVPLPEPVPELFQQVARLAPGEVIEVGDDNLTDEELEAISNA